MNEDTIYFNCIVCHSHHMDSRMLMKAMYVPKFICPDCGTVNHLKIIGDLVEVVDNE